MSIPWTADADLSGVSERPGVYVFKAADGKVLYVGKAANLRARLSNYRRMATDERQNVRFMEKDACEVETIVTRTEKEAFLLEDSLIKTRKPPHPSWDDKSSDDPARPRQGASRSSRVRRALTEAGAVASGSWAVQSARRVRSTLEALTA
jgi:excinuclease ABC subunit C